MDVVLRSVALPGVMPAYRTLHVPERAKITPAAKGAKAVVAARRAKVVVRS